MDTVLEATAGPRRGERWPLTEGEPLSVGRTTKSQIAIPEDKFLSGKHFEIFWKGDSGRLIDHRSANGTYLNGKKISDTVPLKSGDEIRAGDSTFILRKGHAAAAPRPVEKAPSADEITAHPGAQPSNAPMSTLPLPPSRVPAPPPPPARVAPSAEVALRDDDSQVIVGNWRFSTVPAGWEFVEDFGIQETGREGLPSSAMASEEMLPGALSLDDFVQSQVGRVKGFFREPRIERGPVAPVAGAEDTVALDVRYKTKDGQGIYYRGLYVRRGDRVGILTLKTLESELPRVKPIFDTIVSGVSFRTRDAGRS